MNKPIHAKPSLYAFYFESLKEVAKKFGYNLVLHGSLNRDLDLIAIPWQQELGDVDEMMQEFTDTLGGEAVWRCGNATHPHGRRGYVININRAGKWNNYQDAQYYLDISVTPIVNQNEESDL